MMTQIYKDELFEVISFDEVLQYCRKDSDFFQQYANYHKSKYSDSGNLVFSFVSMVICLKIRTSKGENTFGLPDDIIEDAKEGDINRSLLRAGWIMSPYLLNNINNNDLINQPVSLFHDKSRINELIKNIFYSDKLYHLCKMVESWSKNEFFNNRMYLFVESLDLIKLFLEKRRNVNVSSFVIPFLIAQVDGIKNDYLHKKGYSYRRGKLTYNNKEITEWELFNILLKESSLDTLTYYFLILVLEILFGKANPKEKFSMNVKKETMKYFFYENERNIFSNFNRHKIMHGEELGYGNIENLLRLYLILDTMNEVLI